MTKGRAAAMMVFAASLVLTTVVSCRYVPRSGVEFSPGPPVPTPSFEGDSTSDSAMYRYARSQMYRLMTDSGSLRTDSLGVAGSLDACVEQGSGSVDFAALMDGKWRAMGCAIRSGPVSSDYPYLESGLSLILIRRSAGDWQAGVLGLTTSQKKKMFVSALDRASLGSDARRFLEGPHIYMCYTCDRKACCPANAFSVTNPTQAQADVNHIATIW